MGDFEDLQETDHFFHKVTTPRESPRASAPPRLCTPLPLPATDTTSLSAETAAMGNTMLEPGSFLL